MDCSSGAAVAALGLNNNIDDVSGETRVLDLCCCPGAKLCMIVDELLGLRMEVVGVDISDSRLNISKKVSASRLVHKFQFLYFLTPPSPPPSCSGSTS